MKNKTFICLLIVITSLSNMAVAAEAELRIEDAWIAEAPPVSKVMVAYMTMVNTGTKTIDIIDAESDTFSSIEFHETVYEDGMARMISHDSLSIPAGGQLVLKRGGPHFMLFNPAKHLLAGDTKIVSVPVKKAQF